jgi:protein O-mannosyl-transferase
MANPIFFVAFLRFVVKNGSFDQKQAEKNFGFFEKNSGFIVKFRKFFGFIFFGGKAMTPNNETVNVPKSATPRDWWLGVLLVVGVFLAYQPVWHAGFIWDDDRHITQPELRSLHGLARIWTQLGATQQYYPLVHSVFWVEHRLWGDAPLGYHLLNVLLHALSALLLVKILRQLQIPGAWLAAFLFALHPVEVESVAWISELKNTLSGVFYLSAALAYLGFDRNRDRGSYAAALGLFLLGLMSKTVIASLPGALLVIFWWQRGKLSWKRDVLPLVPFFMAGIGAGLLTAWVEKKFIHAEGAAFDFSIVERFLIAGRAIWFYLGKLFWPVDLIFINPRWNVSQAVWWQYLSPAAALGLLVLLWRLRWRGALAASLFFVGTLFPALGFFNVYPFRYSLVADHFQYLAALGPFTLAAVGLNAWGRKPLIVVLLLTLAVLTWRQCGMYANAETLWRATLARNPGSAMARNNLSAALLVNGQVDEAILDSETVLAAHPDNATAQANLGYGLLQKGRLDEAIDHFQKALALQPNGPGVYYQIGEAWLKKGRMDEAIRNFQKAIELQPDYATAFCNLGYALLQAGRRSEAMAAYEKALELDPRYALAHNDLGNILLQLGRMDQAMDHFQQAAAILPGFAEAHFNMAEVYLARGRLDDAISQYNKSLELNPGLAEAHYKLGVIEARQDHEAGAISHYESALKIQPDLMPACNDLAWLLAAGPDPALRDGPRAVALAQRANQLAQGRNPVILATLAAAYAETGQFNEAVKTIEQALPLAANDRALAGALEKQKDAYKAGSKN